MSMEEFVKKIKEGTWSEYHIRTINSVETSVSNPNETKSDNLS